MKRKFSGAIFSNRRFKRTTLSLALAAVFSALVMVATMLIAIPVPTTGGYVNVGDTLIFVSGILFGPFVGGVAGGLGSMLSDVILGYAFYAPFTLIIKGLEGVLCGLLGLLAQRKIKKTALSVSLQVAAMIVSGLFMVSGYFVVEWVAFGSGAAVAAVTGNIIQAIASVALASALLFFCKLGKKVVLRGLQTMPKSSPSTPADVTAELKNQAESNQFNHLSKSETSDFADNCSVSLQTKETNADDSNTQDDRTTGN